MGAAAGNSVGGEGGLVGMRRMCGPAMGSSGTEWLKMDDVVPLFACKEHVNLKVTAECMDTFYGRKHVRSLL